MATAVPCNAGEESLDLGWETMTENIFLRIELRFSGRDCYTHVFPPFLITSLVDTEHKGRATLHNSFIELDIVDFKYVFLLCETDDFFKTKQTPYLHF
jgi:hypothetical protein